MEYNHIMVRFGELYTKGKNRHDFIAILGRNIRNALSSFENIEIEVRYDHIYVVLNGEDPEPIINVLKDVSGIFALSLVIKTNDDIENLKAVALEAMKLESGNTFKVKCKRSNKRYPIHSEEMNRIIAPVILKNTDF
ncbi:MAG: THUMP domain-containing protein, partial [Bacilli bacterium]|nr:THUMP domain-containing protein [Bacilli bacterium]